jgi:hypothetical protein
VVRILCILCPIPTLAAISSTVMQGFDRCQERCAKRGCHADRYLRNAVIAHETRQSGSEKARTDVHDWLNATLMLMQKSSRGGVYNRNK